MTTADTLVYCPCCGHEKPAYDYPRGQHICSICSMLPADHAVLLTRETVRREYGVKKYTAQGRKAARIEARMEQYGREGKRCSACHYYKPVESYNKCAPQPDGLQPNCKQCNKIWMSTKRSGGQSMWITVRDAMRKASPEGK